MPAIKNVLTLEEININFIEKLLYKCINDTKYSKHKLVFREYLIRNLSASLRQKLLSKICKIHIYQLDTNKKCQFLELLGDTTTICINIAGSGSLFIEDVFFLYRTVLMSNFKNLCKFGIDCNMRNLSDRKYIDDVNSIIYKPLTELKNLRWITLKGLGEPILLSTLGSSCPYLEYLDVSDSILVNDASIAGLLLKNPEELNTLSTKDLVKYNGLLNSCSSHLSFLGISGTDVSTSSIILSLLFLPKLYSYGGYLDQSSICEVLIHLQSTVDFKCSNLTELWEDNLSVKQVDILSKLCPALCSLNTSIASLSSLHSIINFSVDSLTLDCDFKDIEWALINFIYYNGSYIKCLLLENSINTKINLVDILEYAPSLVEVCMPLYISDEPNKDLKKWVHLKKCTIEINSIDCLKHFLLQSPLLSDVTLKFVPVDYATETSDSINDTFILDILNSGALKHLESLRINDCGIGLLGLETLIEKCSELKYIEKVFYWKNLSAKDLEYLQHKIKLSNWDLEIIKRNRLFDQEF